jgi:PIN domain nuclease of toxin-antitoxin system
VDEVVLDASALLALLNDEPGSDRVERALPGAVMSAVNLSEVASKLADVKIPGPEIETTLMGFGLEIVPFDAPQALAAGLLRDQTRALGLSLGDRACLALGISRSLPVLTTDRSWTELELGVEVQAIR